MEKLISLNLIFYIIFAFIICNTNQQALSNAVELPGLKQFSLATKSLNFSQPTTSVLTVASPSLNTISPTTNEIIPCTCAVFLSGQFNKLSKEQPKGLPALIHEQDINFPCTPAGIKQCTNKCLDSIVKHLPNSPAILCGSIDRDCYKERAYLFVQNCTPMWINTNLSPGREYCCKDGEPYQCPLINSV